MRIGTKEKVYALAMSALSGRLTPVPEGGAGDILDSFPSLGEVQLAEPSADILKRVARHCGDKGRITHIIVNRVWGDVHISFLIDHPEYPIKSEADILKPMGAIAFVYNNDAPFNSECGSLFFEKRIDKHIYRIG